MLLSDKVEKKLIKQIRERRQEGHLKLPDEHMLADEFGISRKTLRNALDRLKKRKIVRSIKGKGTFIVESTSLTQINPTTMVGMIAPNFKQPMETAIVEGVREYLSGCDLDLILWSSEANPAIEAKYLKRAEQIGISGLIWWPHLPATNHEFVRTMVEDGFPMIMIDRSYPGIDTPVVEPDHYNGMKDAVKHLISLGHKKIGFVTGSAEQRDVVESIKLREQAYIDAMREAGLYIDDRWMVALDPDMLRFADVQPSAMHMVAYEPVHKLLVLDKSIRPTAIVLLFDELAPGSLKAIKNEGLNVPEDISLVGFNDIPVARLLEVPLTTVRYPTRKVGRLAGELMEKLITGEQIERKKYLIETQLVIRSSSQTMGRKVDCRS